MVQEILTLSGTLDISAFWEFMISPIHIYIYIYIYIVFIYYQICQPWDIRNNDCGWFSWINLNALPRNYFVMILHNYIIERVAVRLWILILNVSATKYSFFSMFVSSLKWAKLSQPWYGYRNTLNISVYFWHSNTFVYPFNKI